MSKRYPTANPLDRIFLSIANLVIVFAGAVVLYHCVVTSIDPSPNETTATEGSAAGVPLRRTLPYATGTAVSDVTAGSVNMCRNHSTSRFV